jgi:hypothetical protein
MVNKLNPAAGPYSVLIDMIDSDYLCICVSDMKIIDAYGLIHKDVLKGRLGLGLQEKWNEYHPCD